MHPESLGGASFPVVVALAAFGCGALHLFLVKKAGLERRSFVWAFLIVVLGALAGAKVFSVLVDGGGRSLSTPISQGFRLPGVLFGFLVALPLVRGRLPSGVSLARWADLLAPGAALAFAIIRLECFLAGCCAGKVCSLPWALRFPRGSVAWLNQIADGLIPLSAEISLPVHPLQLYFVALALLACLISLLLLHRTLPPGQVMLAMIMVQSSGKFALEFLRFPAVEDLRWLALSIAITAGGLLVWRSQASSHWARASSVDRR